MSLRAKRSNLGGAPVPRARLVRLKDRVHALLADGLQRPCPIAICDVDLFLFESSPDFGCEFVEQYPDRVIIHIGGIERQDLARKDGDRLAIMSRFGFRARVDNFTAGKHAREKRFCTSIALSHPAMGRTDRLFEIIDPARRAIAGAQAPGNLELAPRTFGDGNEREALHWRNRPRGPELRTMVRSSARPDYSAAR